MRKLIFVLALLLSQFISYSQDNFFGSYSYGTISAYGDVGLYCGGNSYVRFVLINNAGFAIKRFGMIYCDNDCGGYLPIDSPFANTVSWYGNPIIGTFYSVDMSTSLAEGIRYWYQWFVELENGDIIYASTPGQDVAPDCSGVSFPIVTTLSITNITNNSASGGGNVTSDGGSTVTARGIVWNRTGSPTTSSYDGITNDGTGTGSFTSSLSSLDRATNYYVRAYATNSDGTAYGSEVSFTTDPDLPTVYTNTVDNFGDTYADFSGSVTSDGGGTVSARGFVYATHSTPTLSDSVTTSGSGVGLFLASVSNLSPATTYYVRSYATNEAGTAYGNEETFETLSSSYPYYYTTGGTGYSTVSDGYVTLDMPSGYASGQVAVAVIYIEKTSGTGSCTAPTGWTKLSEYATTTNVVTWFAKVLDGSESSSYNFDNTYTTMTKHWGAIFSYENATGFTSPSGFYTAGFYGPATTFDVTPTPTNNRLGVTFCAIPNDDLITVSGDFSQDVNTIDFGFNLSISAASVVGDGTQKTATFTWTNNVLNAGTYVELEIY